MMVLVWSQWICSVTWLTWWSVDGDADAATEAEYVRDGISSETTCASAYQTVHVTLRYICRSFKCHLRCLVTFPCCGEQSFVSLKHFVVAVKSHLCYCNVHRCSPVRRPTHINSCMHQNSPTRWISCFMVHQHSSSHGINTSLSLSLVTRQTVCDWSHFCQSVIGHT